MADQSPDAKFLKIVGPAVVSTVGAAFGWLSVVAIFIRTD